ncbi:valine--tRNA ligase, mitochondrial-like isoform X2 [Prorops nasuta]|uniref:valine--tRNA ligase, mitochondrial-like isoform X2 n=1 Tax=Prorops nasuta TaxID=863751 RepID=UPI0034CF94FD
MQIHVQRINSFPRFIILYKRDFNRHVSHLLQGFPEKYDLKMTENGRYEIWMQNNYFNPNNIEKETFKMILPPPNITGVLHLGHALTVTIQDILSRWHRMRGYPVTWIPGLDHAGSATQVIVEKMLKKQTNLSKSDMSKDEFLKFVEQWKLEKGDTIRSQLKTLGATLDWSKEFYTLNEDHNISVTEAFIKLYKKELLYRHKTLINWSHALGSTISDIEIENLCVDGKTMLEVPGYDRKVAFGEIAEIAFQIKDSNKKIVVATTRPETLHGDVAIAVHPQDSRYADLIGQDVWHPLREVYVPIIADSLVDRNFGTGAVKITPAHDRLDFIIAQNHKLSSIDVINENGTLTNAAKSFMGLKKFHARSKILSKLSELGALQSMKEHKVMLPLCSRSGDVIELILKEQWFLKCEKMAERAMDAVKTGSLKIDPKSREEEWFDYLQNIKDWCISRQLIWGHRIPAYYATTNGNFGEWIPARSMEEAKRIAQEKYSYKNEIVQDCDVLDTWFSSALLPLTIAGWPNNWSNYKKYYPLTLLETGKDILCFWVARMAMLGLELSNQLPFENILLHGLITDSHGRKMSKSVGNVILPDHVIHGIDFQSIQEETKKTFEAGLIKQQEFKRTVKLYNESLSKGIPECGTDALRMTLCAPHNVKDQTISFNVAECETNKRFLNKIWQACRYVLGVIEKGELIEPAIFSDIDKWILSRLAFMVQNVNEALSTNQFNKAILSMKEFLYHEFCDVYIEATKFVLSNNHKDMDENEINIASHTYTLAKCLEVFLRSFAPVAPYFTDDLYLRLSERLSIFSPGPSIFKTSYPVSKEKYRDIDLEEKVREARKIMNPLKMILSYVNKSETQVYIVVKKLEDRLFLEKSLSLIRSGTKIVDIQVRTYQSYKPKPDSIYGKIEPDKFIYLKIKNADKEKQIKQMIVEKRESILKELEDQTNFIRGLRTDKKTDLNKKIKAEAKIKRAINQLESMPMLGEVDFAETNVIKEK